MDPRTASAAELIGRGRDYARRGVALAKAKGQPMILFLFSLLGGWLHPPRFC